jgi:FixJ family two-component response regulator
MADGLSTLYHDLLGGSDDCVDRIVAQRTAQLATTNQELREAIAERKLTEAALQQAQADLARAARVTTMGETAAAIAHETNQPLAAIITEGEACLRWLAQSPPKLGEVREAVNCMVSEANRASSVITRIRTLLNRGVPTQVPVDIDETIREVLVLQRGLLEIRNVSVRAELGAGGGPVIGDRVLLQKVMQNLIMNGVEAMIPIMDRPRQLLVRSKLDGIHSVQVEVQDSGVGLDPTDVERICYKKTKRDGYGVVHQPLDHRSAWRPHLGISGRSLRCGLSIHPADRGCRYRMTQEQPVVIVVDDDPSIRKAIDRLLRSVGLRVELFESAQEFLQSNRLDTPSCIVLDVRLPGQSGLNLQRDLAAAHMHVPVIFVTARGDIPMSVRAMKAGAVEFLTKPFHDQDLLDAIEVALGKDRARRAEEKLIAELRERLDHAATHLLEAIAESFALKDCP